MERSKGAKEELLREHLRAQQGVIAAKQARAIGFDRHWAYRATRRGSFAWIVPGVLLSASTPPSWEQDLMALLLWAGDEAAASFRAAARLWEVDGFRSAPVEITTTNLKNATDLTTSRGRRLVVHHSDDHLLSEIVSINGISVTSPRKTVLDLAGSRHRKAEWALDFFLRRQLTDIGQVWLLLEQEWMRGRRGVAILRDLLIPRTRDRAPTDSQLEIDMTRLLDSGGLQAPVRQHAVSLPTGTIRLDLSYPDIKLAIEVDSYSWHMDREAFESDRARDNQLRRQGWTVLRITWAMMRFEPEQVLETIREVAETLRRNRVA